MKANSLQYSIVVIGQDHNPTILNPDFLQIQNIVPKEWGWKISKQPITVPPFAIVQYDNGVSITVEQNKLQVSENKTNDPTTSKIAEVVRQYVKVLPYVHYTAVGINFHNIIDIQDPKYLKERFLKQGSWDSSSRPVDAVGLKLVYPLSGGRIVLSLDSGEADRKTEGGLEKSQVVLAKINFHRDCKKYPANEEIGSHLNNIASDWDQNQSILNDTLN